MCKKIIYAFFISCYSVVTYCQDQPEVVKKIGKDPLFFVDSTSITKAEFRAIIPDSIASVTVIVDQEAMNILGEKAKDGIIYVDTKKFARFHYWKYFTSKSPEYLSIVPNPYSDSKIQYIINSKPLGNKDFEGDLASINYKNFKKLIILSKKDLINNFKIVDKEYGVQIFTDYQEKK